MKSPVIAVCILAAQLTVQPSVHAADTTQHVCDKWSKIAKDMTGSGHLQTCRSGDASNCTRLDCNGGIKFSNFLLPGRRTSPLELDYCFSIQMNSCTQPVSMDFYLQLPSMNINKSLRINEDQNIDLKDVALPLGYMGTASPQLDFEFERSSDGNIRLSVISKVKVTSFGHSIFLDHLQRTLLDQETIHMLPCPPGTVKDRSNKPPKDFMPSTCHPQKYKKKWTTKVPPTTVQPSASKTLNKSCDSVAEVCGIGELCDTSTSPARCACKQEMRLSVHGDACVSINQLHQPCQAMGDCGYNEMCLPDSGGTLTCQCAHGNQFSAFRQICVRPPPGGWDMAKPSKPSKTTVPHTTTVKGPVLSQPATGEATNDTHGKAEKHTQEKAKAGNNKISIIIGASVGGCVLMSVIIANIYLFRRYRRQRQRADVGMSSNGNRRLLGNDDDDNNMIM